MKDIRWEEKSLEERMAVYKVYRETLYKCEGLDISFEQCDAGWTGSRWITIYYTFGVEN